MSRFGVSKQLSEKLPLGVWGRFGSFEGPWERSTDGPFRLFATAESCGAALRQCGNDAEPLLTGGSCYYYILYVLNSSMDT